MEKISAIMPMKNEEDLLDICLSHFHNYVDEIIIADTGSTDKSIEISSKYTNQIININDFTDFSIVKNKLLSMAKNKWIFTIDSDMILIPLVDDPLHLTVETAEKENANMAYFPVFEFTDKFPYIDGWYYKGWLFKKEDYTFVNKVHVHATPIHEEKGISSDNILLHHYRWLKKLESINARRDDYRKLKRPDSNGIYSTDLSKCKGTISYKDVLYSKRLKTSIYENIYKYDGPFPEEILDLPWVKKYE